MYFETRDNRRTFTYLVWYPFKHSLFLELRKSLPHKNLANQFVSFLCVSPKLSFREYIPVPLLKHITQKMAPWSPAEIESLHNFADENTELLEEPPLAGPKKKPKKKPQKKPTKKNGAARESKVKKKLPLDNRKWTQKLLSRNREAPDDLHKQAVFELVMRYMDAPTQRDYLSEQGKGSERAYKSVQQAFELSKDEWGGIVLEMSFVDDPDLSDKVTIFFILPMTKEEFDGYGDLLQQDVAIYKTARDFAYKIAKEIFPELFDGEIMVSPSLSQKDATEQNMTPGQLNLFQLKFLGAGKYMYLKKKSIEDFFGNFLQTKELRLLERIAYKGKKILPPEGIVKLVYEAVVVATQQEVEEFMKSINPDDYYDPFLSMAQIKSF